MACTQLVVIEQPKKEEEFTIALRSPYEHPMVVAARIFGPLGATREQLAKLVYGE